MGDWGGKQPPHHQSVLVAGPAYASQFVKINHFAPAEVDTKPPLTVGPGLLAPRL